MIICVRGYHWDTIARSTGDERLCLGSCQYVKCDRAVWYTLVEMATEQPHNGSVRVNDAYLSELLDKTFGSGLGP